MMKTDYEELCECTFTEEEIRNSVGLPDEDLNAGLKTVKAIREKYLKDLSPEEWERRKKDRRKKFAQMRREQLEAFSKRKKERLNANSFKNHE